MKRYNPKDIEPKWQKIWDEQKQFEVTEDPSKTKKYVIDMFPYPSGAAMHVGHMRNYTISDVISQFLRQKGYNVLHTIGWDTFGLPAENYAIKTGVAPQVSIKQNIANFTEQLKALGMSYDWSREVNTSDPEYYRWTQWIFTELFNQGLAYQKESAQWWCETDKTVLANEQVEAGKCWRCGNDVIKKNMKQWFFKITDYAEDLLNDIDDLDWPEKIKIMQRNWIGKSQGAEVSFKVVDGENSITVFTTRPDTIYGATFLVLAPEHAFVDAVTSSEQKEAIQAYKKATLAKSDIARQENKEKSGVFTGGYAINPANGEQIPIWIADYVLPGYGTGAVMAVPAHDERDFEFATVFDLPVRQVVATHVFGTGHDTPRDDFETLHRPVVDAIITDGNNNYLIQIENEHHVHFVGGGIDDTDIDTESALRREIVEEVGLTRVISIKQAAPYSAGTYCRETKNRNQQVWGAFFEVIVDPLEQIESEIEQGLHTVEWVKKDDVLKRLTWDGHKKAWLSYLEGKTIDTDVREGLLVNSGEFDGMPSSEAREKIVQKLAASGDAEAKTNFKMRDWLISRQRYWGAPIPIIHCAEHGAVPVPKEQLPVVLPEVENYQPTGGQTVLATVDEWVNTTCPTCGGPAKRETDTMDGYACSSWYFLRYADPKNDEAAWNREIADYWLPVDYYCGGDHAVSHLLYTRFWFHFFAKQGWIENTRREPVGKLVYNGYILAEDGNKMSKSKGNTIDPREIINQGYGADSVRVFEMFIAPYELSTSWNANGVPGTYRFLQRYWTLAQEYFEETEEDAAAEDKLLKATHKVIKRITNDLEVLSFNTAVAGMMEYINELYKIKAEHGYKARAAWQFALSSFTQLLAPFAPHISEEVWQQLGNTDSVHTAHWPEHDNSYLVEDTITLAVQVNGKVRAEITLNTDASEEEVKALALANERVQEFLQNKEPTRVIYVPGRLVNIVV